MGPLSFTVTDDSIPVTAGAGKVTYRMPAPYLPAYVSAGLTAAQSAGSAITIDVNRAGVSILSTKLTIDNTEKTSVTAAVQPVLTGASFAFDQELTIDVDQIGNGTAKGLKVTLYDEMPTLPEPEAPPPPPPPSTEVLIDRTIGTHFGNMSVFGLGQSFDGINSEPGASCGAVSGVAGYVGTTFSAGKKFSRALVYCPTDRGFVHSASAVSINIRGKNGVPSGRTDGTIIGSAACSGGSNLGAIEIISTDTANAWTSIWADISGSPQDSTYCGELVMYERV